MGTNYYIDHKQPCPTCDRDHVCQLHLGKSSYGWTFTFQFNGGDYYKTRAEMEAWTRKLVADGAKIRNEYDEEVTPDEFWQMVDRKAKESANRTHGKEYADHTHVGADGTYFEDGYFS